MQTQTTHLNLDLNRLLYVSKMASSASAAHIVFAFLLSSLLLFSGTEINLAISWMLSIYLIIGIRYFSAKQIINKFHSSQVFDDGFAQSHIRNQAIILFVLSITWSLSFILLFMVESKEHQTGFHMIAAIFAVGLIAGGIISLSPIRSIYYTFALPMTIAIAYLFFQYGDTFHTMSGIAILSGLIFLTIFGRLFTRQFDERIQKTKEAKDTEFEIINRLSKASEFRDEETGNHILRMSYNCYLLSLECGFSQEKAELMRYASSLHDVGKIGISDNILLKPGKLTVEERELMNEHPQIGAKILAHSNSELIKLAETIAKYHHEKVDGTGYPFGLKGDEIPFEARIAAICDVYDALISERPYKKAWSNESALSFIIENSGNHFDSQLVEKFKKIHPRIVKYAQLHSD